MFYETKQALDFDNIKGYLWCDLINEMSVAYAEIAFDRPIMHV